MITKEVGILLGVVGALIVGGGIAYAASSKPAAPAQTPPTAIPFTAGHRYQVTVTFTSGAVPAGVSALAYIEGQASTLSPAPFDVVSVTASLGGAGVLPYVSYEIDALPSVVGTGITVSTTTLAFLAGAVNPPNTFTVAVDDLGLSSSLASSSSSSHASSSAAAQTATPPASTVVVGGPAPPQWTTDITVGVQGATVSAWPGDEIVIALPTGATWAPSGSSTSFPTSGSAPTGPITYQNPGTLVVVWVFGGSTYTTSIRLVSSRTWTAASSWHTDDTVRISINASDYQAAQMAAAAAPQEAAAIQAYAAANAKNPANPTPAEAMTAVLAAGAWGQLFQPDPSSVLVFVPPIIPSDWPTADTTGIMRLEFIYRGPGVALSALPFPVTSWVRST